MESRRLVGTQQLHSLRTSSKTELINEWLTRFALNADKALDSNERALYLSTWADGFADVEVDRLKAAFVTCLRSLTFKTMPTIGDVRQFLAKAETAACQFEAEQKWMRVLDYLRAHYSADGVQRKIHRPNCPRHRCDCPDAAPRITARTEYAIRASGGLAYLNECERESLQWAKKRFIEAYIAWSELEQGRFLLPDGPIKQAFAMIAELKRLPENNARAERNKLVSE